MDLRLRFNFRNKERQAFAVIDAREQPCLIFAVLIDNELVNEFGDELTIQTDCETVLNEDISIAGLELREAIFSAIKHTAEFQKATAEYHKSPKWPSHRHTI